MADSLLTIRYSPWPVSTGDASWRMKDWRQPILAFAGPFATRCATPQMRGKYGVSPIGARRSAHMTASAITPKTPDARKHHRAAQRPRGQPRSPAQICSLYVPEFARMSRCLEARRAPARGMLEERKRARLKLNISTSAECERLFRDEPRRAAALADRYPKLAGEIAREAE